MKIKKWFLRVFGTFEIQIHHSDHHICFNFGEGYIIDVHSLTLHSISHLCKLIFFISSKFLGNHQNWCFYNNQNCFKNERYVSSNPKASSSVTINVLNRRQKSKVSDIQYVHKNIGFWLCCKYYNKIRKWLFSWVFNSNIDFIHFGRKSWRGHFFHLQIQPLPGWVWASSNLRWENHLSLLNLSTPSLSLSWLCP